ncbi:required for respiratory growth protein 9, mitochondrial [Dendryphion nanum]|uniref:Required for respiratory growth protein 9, mitochondrial n=1 Tax=Dendryphion nanum TaxID=256645 RepID=A0A9P9DMX5_9PLEO|nr:required for respiratory growth protein 9, mitochondrial [Dendryphion nanum]
MNCTFCPRKTLSLFIRSLAPLELPSFSRTSGVRFSRAAFSSAASRQQDQIDELSKPPGRTQNRDTSINDEKQSSYKPRSPRGITERPPPKKKERWQIEKAAIKEKLKGEAWNPRKKLSPDTMEGIRHLNSTHPEKFTTPILAQYFKVSPDAIRRILKSKWRPSDDEQDERLARWDKRGEKIWSNLVELGVKPPKKWREMGVGKAERGQLPKWKSRERNRVPVNDSSSGPDLDDLIPIVDASGERLQTPQRRPMGSRFG